MVAESALRSTAIVNMSVSLRVPPLAMTAGGCPLSRGAGDRPARGVRMAEYWPGWKQDCRHLLVSFMMRKTPEGERAVRCHVHCRKRHKAAPGGKSPCIRCEDYEPFGAAALAEEMEAHLGADEVKPDQSAELRRLLREAKQREAPQNRPRA